MASPAIASWRADGGSEYLRAGRTALRAGLEGRPGTFRTRLPVFGVAFPFPDSAQEHGRERASVSGKPVRRRTPLPPVRSVPSTPIASTSSLTRVPVAGRSSSEGVGAGWEVSADPAGAPGFYSERSGRDPEAQIAVFLCWKTMPLRQGPFHRPRADANSFTGAVGVSVALPPSDCAGVETTRAETLTVGAPASLG